MSLNRVILVGNVGKDPVIRYFDKGVAKATFPLATSEVYTNQKGETITTTEWHNIVLWRSLAEIAEKTVKKGTQLYIVGKIKTRSYTDKDGINKYITEIIADTMFVLERRQATSTQVSYGASHEPSGNDNMAEPHVIYNNGKGNGISEPAQEPEEQGEWNKEETLGTKAEDDLPF